MLELEVEAETVTALGGWWADVHGGTVAVVVDTFVAAVAGEILVAMLRTWLGVAVATRLDRPGDVIELVVAWLP